jgi:UDP-galactose transporter
MTNLFTPLLCLLLLVMLNVANILTCRLALDSKGQFPFLISTLVVCTEAGKLTMTLISCYFSFGLRGTVDQLKTHADFPLIRSYLGLALCYALLNNVSYLLYEHVDPLTILIFGSSSVLSTALLLRFALAKPISRVQWFALLFVFLALVFSQYNPRHGGLTFGFLAYALCMCADVLSACGGVYNEFLLKTRVEAPLQIQNLVLYSFGTVLNLAFVLVLRFRQISEAGFFSGYSILTAVIILLRSVDGLMISAVLKYTDNLVKVFASSITIVAVMVLSLCLFGVEYSFVQILGCLQCVLAVVLYQLEASNAPKQQPSYQRIAEEPSAL